MEEESTNFEESNIGIGFTSKEGLSKEDIVMEAWRDCRQKRAVEMKKGYFNVKMDKQGNISKNWIPDTRDTYISSVQAFDIVLTSDFDEEYKKQKGKLIEKAGKMFNKFGYKKFIVKKYPLKNIHHGFRYAKKYTGSIMMPEISRTEDKLGRCAVVCDINSRGEKIAISWDSNYHEYMQHLIFIYDELFAELVTLLARLKYFKKKMKVG